MLMERIWEPGEPEPEAPPINHVSSLLRIRRQPSDGRDPGRAGCLPPSPQAGRRGEHAGPEDKPR